jgi:hypothetical protein
MPRTTFRKRFSSLFAFSLAVASLTSQHLSATNVTTPGLGPTNTITVSNGTPNIVSSAASADSSGNIFNVGMLTANMLVTAPASAPTGATGQGLATILVATSGATGQL